MRFRGKSIRRKIVVLLLVPLVSLVSIWGFATYITGRRGQQLLRRGRSPSTRSATPPRTLSRHSRGTPPDPRPPRRPARAPTARPPAQVQRRDRPQAWPSSGATRPTAELRSDLDPDADARLEDLLDELDGLGKLRSQVEHNTDHPRRRLPGYNELVDPAYAFLGSLNGLDDAELDKQGRALVGATRAREYLSREDALMAAALVAGKFDPGRPAGTLRPCGRAQHHLPDQPVRAARRRPAALRATTGTAPTAVLCAVTRTPSSPPDRAAPRSRSAPSAGTRP